MAPTWVNVLIACVSLGIFTILMGLFFWLMDGWITPGIAWFLFAAGICVLFVVFGWILLIALGAIACIVAGIFAGSDSSNSG